MRFLSSTRSSFRAPAARRTALATAVLVALLGLQGLGQPAWAQGAAVSSVRAGEPVTLNFENADIEAVARAMATITGRNVVVDPRVRGTVNLVTANPVPPQAAFTQFLAALRMQSFTVVESAGLYKVVPEADAKLQSGTVSVSDGSRSGRVPQGGQIVTQIFKLNFENANSLVPTLRPLISPNNTITVTPGSNSLVITDYADNLQRLARIIAALDVAEASDIEVIHLQHAIASDVVPMLNRLLGAELGSAAGGTPTPGATPGQGFRTTLLADARSNAIILRAANPARVAQVRSLVQQLDQPPLPGSSAEHGNIHVVFLKNADATQMAQTLRAALSAGRVGGSSGGTTTPASTGSSVATASSDSSAGLASTSALGEGGTATLGVGQAVSTGGIIQADPNANALIITAPDPLYRQLRGVIDKLDGRRAQVLVESLVVEVNADLASEFGIQWQGGFGNDGSSNVGVIGTNYSSTSGAGRNIIDLALAAALGYTDASTSTITTALANARPSTGLNFGLAHNYGGTYVLGLLARFLEGTGKGNVLSTPNILTLDNQEARIVIGQNVPFVTGQYTSNNTSSGSVNPFQTVERQDVGISLRVKPQISESGTVKLAVVQEVSDVIASSINNANGPTTSKRLIETNILVDDGGIVVLGGLLQDSYAQSQDKVPLLGDLPLIGNAFRSESRQRTKTNLMVFLRPVVVRDAASSDALAWERYDLMREAQSDMQPNPHPIMRSIGSAPQLPALPELPPTTVAPPQPLPAALSGIQPQQSAVAAPIVTPSRPAQTVPSLTVLSAPDTEPPRRRPAVDVRTLRVGESSGWED
ncbi:general secretion pathway protein D [Lampropedia hyalina DSM 16112]|jgi:general secretion pathway protein D|uniref:General secretion pathway protein D n=1 Tax=Lampropedia hyalina DSM 16112 TaxID=1122156 RepID=A0A1M5E017_9BURK|nr:type II secretion system secretin GspD [Lampropedia hyalina]SHF72421.1 general secretion pathway protein D [Lampropedia hyalina DSM 16112]